jgi:hypothetical protein
VVGYEIENLVGGFLAAGVGVAVLGALEFAPVFVFSDGLLEHPAIVPTARTDARTMLAIFLNCFPFFHFLMDERVSYTILTNSIRPLVGKIYADVVLFYD